MSRTKIELVPQLVIPPRDQATCQHTWSYHTYTLDGMVTSKKLCPYCKKVEDTL